jgi:Zn finger protein HypA/HybF involved in hydrogenase expression
MEKTIKWKVFRCKDCGYETIIYNDAMALMFCPTCDSPNLEVVLEEQIIIEKD